MQDDALPLAVLLAALKTQVVELSNEVAYYVVGVVRVAVGGAVVVQERCVWVLL